MKGCLEYKDASLLTASLRIVRLLSWSLWCGGEYHIFQVSAVQYRKVAKQHINFTTTPKKTQHFSAMLDRVWKKHFSISGKSGSLLFYVLAALLHPVLLFDLCWF